MCSFSSPEIFSYQVNQHLDSIKLLVNLVIIETQDVTFDKSKDASKKFCMTGVDYDDCADG